MYVRDKRRHPGQKDAEVQQNVQRHGDHPSDEHDHRLVECML